MKGEALERRTRPKAEASGGVSGGRVHPTPSSIITTERAKRSSGARGRMPRQTGGGGGRREPPRPMMIQKATERRSARAAHEAEGRVNGGVRGGGSPPATTIHYYNNSNKALKRRTRPKAEANEGAVGGREPLRYHHPLLQPKR